VVFTKGKAKIRQ